MEEMKNEDEKKHIILVHGAGVGAWCWYKVATQLRSAGYRVTVPDMAAAGRDGRPLTQIATFQEYSKPLLDILQSLPHGEKVILVGHSFGGIVISLAMEEFPEKIHGAVFVTALLPDCNNKTTYVIEKIIQGASLSIWMDTKFDSYSIEDKVISTILYGPEFYRSKLSQLCSPEDITLGLSLIRAGSLFIEDLQSRPPLSKNRYGSVDKFYIVCAQDLAITEESQNWMTGNYPVKEVKRIENVDHMAMLSAPNELSKCILEFASLYS